MKQSNYPFFFLSQKLSGKLIWYEGSPAQIFCPNREGIGNRCANTTAIIIVATQKTSILGALGESHS